MKRTGQKHVIPLARIFRPILVGATLRERLVGCLGALLGICLTGFVCGFAFGDEPLLPLIVAPIGASAVLLFAVPASPLAQPWPIVGGNTISAAVGVTVAYFVSDSAVSIGLAVGLAILAMSLTRCLHPPGGAAALTAVIGGAAVARAGFWFPLVPVAINSALLVGVGIIFHWLTARQYPHRPPPSPSNIHKTDDPPASRRVGFSDLDIDAAISVLNETLDVDRADIEALLREVERQALLRQRGEMTCADIMSRDIVSVRIDASPEEARELLINHDIRTLPVLNAKGKLVGTVGLRELASHAVENALPVSPAVTARPEDRAVGLLSALTDGATHAVVIVDNENEPTGIISQTDLLATLAKHLSSGSSSDLMRGHGQGI